jgi:hypothetical protein
MSRASANAGLARQLSSANETRAILRGGASTLSVAGRIASGYSLITAPPPKEALVAASDLVVDRIGSRGNQIGLLIFASYNAGKFGALMYKGGESEQTFDEVVALCRKERIATQDVR